MNKYSEVKSKLLRNPKIWLVTGVAGFIGSNLLETLLKLNQTVVGLDNFATGHWQNLEEVKLNVHEEQWERFYFLEGDIRNLKDCEKAMSVTINGELHRVDFVLHQAALGSVPRSINDPITTNDTNISGFLNMLVAAKNAEVSSFTYAASSSTYGDHPGLPKHEHLIGKPLSPYAVTKYVNELYADVFFKAYAFNSIGLRYFNVFGRRQDPHGAYAAVIPAWASAIISGDDVYINGDGETSRDFCYIENTVQANILAAVATNSDALNQVYNVAVGDNTSLNDLFYLIRDFLVSSGISYNKEPIYREQRKGDVRHSLACVDKARDLLGYQPDFNMAQGLEQAMGWYVQQQR